MINTKVITYYTYQIPHIEDKKIKLSRINISEFSKIIHNLEPLPLFASDILKSLRFRFELWQLENNVYIPDISNSAWFVENHEYYVTTGNRLYYYEFYDIVPRDFAGCKEWDMSMTKESRVLFSPLAIPHVRDQLLPKGLSLDLFKRTVIGYYRTRAIITDDDIYCRYLVYKDFNSEYDVPAKSCSWFTVNRIFFQNYSCKVFYSVFSENNYPGYRIYYEGVNRFSDFYSSKLPSLAINEVYRVGSMTYKTLDSLVFYCETHGIVNPVVTVDTLLLGGGGDKQIMPKYALYVKEKLFAERIDNGYYLAIQPGEAHCYVSLGFKNVIVLMSQFKVYSDSIVMYCQGDKQHYDISMLKGTRIIGDQNYLDWKKTSWVVFQSTEPFRIKIRSMVGERLDKAVDFKIVNPSTIEQLSRQTGKTVNQVRKDIYHDPTVGKMIVTPNEFYFSLSDDMKFNWKGALLEYCQKQKIDPPDIVVQGIGPDHMKNFSPLANFGSYTVNLLGNFKTKKDAINNLCFMCLEYLKKHKLMMSEYVTSNMTNLNYSVVDKKVEVSFSGKKFVLLEDGKLSQGGKVYDLNDILNEI